MVERKQVATINLFFFDSLSLSCKPILSDPPHRWPSVYVNRSALARANQLAPIGGRSWAGFVWAHEREHEHGRPAGRRLCIVCATGAKQWHIIVCALALWHSKMGGKVRALMNLHTVAAISTTFFAPTEQPQIVRCLFFFFFSQLSTDCPVVRVQTSRPASSLQLARR